MKYKDIQLAKFIFRENRFIAFCRLIDSNEVVKVHVKNTGRGKEILLPEALVALNYQPSAKRKTAYDLVAVKKDNFWINIDSQLPNRLVRDGLKTGIIELSGLQGNLTLVKPEVRFEHSQFDFYVETDHQEKVFIEVKGMTLENHGIGAFPDAPTLRGLRHVQELQKSTSLGYRAYLIFIAQFEPIQLATLHTEMQPLLTTAVAEGILQGLKILVYNCQVSQETVSVKERVPFDLDFPFEDPNQI